MEKISGTEAGGIVAAVCFPPPAFCVLRAALCFLPSAFCLLPTALRRRLHSRSQVRQALGSDCACLQGACTQRQRA